MSRLDAVIMPSRWEAFGLVAAETLAARRALLCSRIDGLVDHACYGATYVDVNGQDRLTSHLVTRDTLCLAGNIEMMQNAGVDQVSPKIHRVKQDDIESWHDTVCDVFSRTRYMPLSREKFSGELTYTTFGNARMTRVQSTAVRFERDHDEIKQDNFDGYLIMLSLQGDMRLKQNDMALQAGHGDVLVYRHGTPFKIEFPDKYWAVSLWVEPDIMQRHCPNIASTVATIIKPDTTNGALTQAMIKQLCISAVSKGTTDATRLVAATLDVMSTTGAQLEPAESTRNGWVLEKLAKFVDCNIEDTDLTLNSLVDVGGVSPRTLNRAFAEKGTTPMRWLWDRRLDQAYDALAFARMRNVTEAAYSYGFKDASHFSRAFSRKFGVSPVVILQRG